MSRTGPVVLALVAAPLGLWALAPRPVERTLPAADGQAAPSAAGRLVVDLVDGADLADLAAVEAVVGVDLEWVHPLAEDEALSVGEAADLAAAVAALRGHPLVEVAEAEIELEALGYPDDPLYERQWHLRAMGAPAGWAGTPRGAGVVVAVIDTGVSAVEDLDPARLLAGASFVDGAATAADDNGHGTHVAGTIAQTTNNGIGVAGVAPEARILPVKVLSAQGFGTSAAIAAGIDYAADEGADVINLSLGGGYSAVVHTAVRKAREAGVVVVAAAGNTGRRGVSWPGALEETIGVAATGPDGAIAPYSSFGPGVDLAAPGGDKRQEGGGVWQDTISGGGHAVLELQGTSMASPHVAGAAAILLSTGECGPACVEQALVRSARGRGWDEKLGHGQLDLGAALSATGDRWRAVRFLLGGLVGWLIGGLSGRRGFAALAAAVGAAAAGGLFFLDAWVAPSLAVRLLSTGLLAWPGVLLGPDWAHFPLACSAAAPVLGALALGGTRVGRALALGLAAGVGAALFHAAFTGALSPWWLSSGAGVAWLVGNGTVAWLVALSLAGAEKLDAGGAR